MAQIVALGVSLGASKAGLLVGYRLLNLDGTEQVAFTRTNVVESATIPGDYLVTVPVSISDNGAIAIWGISGTDYWQYTIDPVQAMTLADDAITDAKIAASAVTEIQSGLATSAALTTVGDNVALILADTGTDGVVLSSTTLTAIADALLKRSVSNVESTASTHSLAEIILAMLESSAPSTTWTIRKTDGTTFNTRTLTELAGALPVVGVT